MSLPRAQIDSLLLKKVTHTLSTCESTHTYTHLHGLKHSHINNDKRTHTHTHYPPVMGKNSNIILFLGGGVHEVIIL